MSFSFASSKFRFWFSDSEISHLTNRVGLGSAGVFAINAGAIILAFAISVLLARSLGASHYGLYSYVTTIVGILCLPLSFGLPSLVVRYGASYRALVNWAFLKGLLRRANQIVLVATLVGAGLAFAGSWLLRNQYSPEALRTFWLSLPLLPIIALTSVQRGILQSMGRSILGKMPETVIKHGVLILLLILGMAFLDKALTPSKAMAFQVVASSVALGAALYFLKRSLPTELNKADPAFDHPSWLRSALPFTVLGTVDVINSHTDILMLGMFLDTESVGIYRVAARGAELTTFFIMAVDIPLATLISSLHTQNDMVRLQKIITLCARATFFLTLPLSCVLIVYGDHFLTTLYGAEYKAGALALSILCLGQLINVFMGSVAILLSMTGHERDAATGIGFSAVVNLALNAALIPMFGISGAATATAASLLTWNIYLAFKTDQRIGIHSTALGPTALRRGTP